MRISIGEVMPRTVKEFGGQFADGTHARATVERVEFLRSYSALRLRVMVRLARLPERLPIRHGIDLYRVSYWTEHLGRPEIASGLYALPRGRAPMATVTWMNGTNPTRSEAPSSGGLRGLFIAAAFAGSGFLLLAPDYLGLGVSPTYHPYMYAPTTETACIDFMQAAQAVSRGLGVAWRSEMMLVGHSQGAFSTAVVQRSLEATPIPGIDVRAAAGLASPLNPAEVTAPLAFAGASTEHSMYLAFLAHAYTQIYEKPLDTLLTDEYTQRVPILFDGEHSADDIGAQLPRDPREMFRPGVIDAFLAGESSWFREALRGNEAVHWTPRAPLRLYYGEQDLDVPPDDSIRAASEMKTRGGNVELVSLGPYDHTSVLLHGVPRVRAWFTDLMNGCRTDDSG